MTPRARSAFTGGTGADGGHEVMIATSARASSVGGLLEQTRRDRPERERVADGDAPLKAGGDRALGDVAKLRRAGLADVVQMNVDSLAERLGEAEHDVELALDVAVEARRVEAADEVGAGHERRGQEIGRPGLRRHAALRERDELNVDPVAKGLAHPDDRFEIVEADVIVDVDVAARARRAVGDQRADERRRAGLDRQRDPMALDALGGDALAHAASLDMGQARRAPMGLVEMDVAVDERRQEEHPVEVDALVGRRRGPRRVQSRR